MDASKCPDLVAGADAALACLMGNVSLIAGHQLCSDLAVLAAAAAGARPPAVAAVSAGWLTLSLPRFWEKPMLRDCVALAIEGTHASGKTTDVLQRPLAELRGVVLPLLGEPGDRGSRQAVTGAQELLNAAAKSLVDRPCRYSSGNASLSCGNLRHQAGRIAEENRIRREADTPGVSPDGDIG